VSATSTPPFRGWPPEALTWFAGLEADNSRTWFQANRRTYDEAVRQPLESLLAELHEEFGEAKVFRPNRDTRFSKDKTPYKTNVAALISHSDDPGGWYIELSGRGLFLGGGLYHPERERLARLRAAMDDERSGAELERVVADLSSAGLDLLSDGALRTAPRGYAADHPRIELLRLVNVAAGRLEPPRRWLHTAKAKDHVVSTWRALRPLLDWIAAH
jgi:uncharacterized protein (TIGR02453 family)